MSIRVLVADDSALFRRVMAEALASIPEAEVVGSARNGTVAVQMVEELRPDVLTLDMEMPDMDGLGVLNSLRDKKIEMAVILVSALTVRGGELTLQALAKGAFDFITKPCGDSTEANLLTLREELSSRLRALSHRFAIRSIIRAGTSAPLPVPSRPPVNTHHYLGSEVGVPRPTRFNRTEMVLIGVSTGGPNALRRVVADLPGNLGVPVLIVQHMPPLFTRMLADNLSSSSPLTIREAVDGESILPNHVYIAPGGKQMRLVARGKTKVIQITDDPPENNCKPAVDYLFRSVANHFPGQAMAVILTGMGNDGTSGLRQLKAHGCRTLAQDEASCVVFGMPKAAIDAGVVDSVLPLEEIGGRIASLVRGGAA